jgi:hypothetical protein
MDPYYAMLTLLLVCAGIGTAVFSIPGRNAEPARGRHYTLVFATLFAAGGILLAIKIAMFLGYL